MSTAMKRPLAGHAGTGTGGPTSSGPGAQRAAAGQQQQQHQQQQPAHGQASSQHSSPMLPSASSNSSTINGGSGGVASSGGGGGASAAAAAAAAVGGATLNTELRAQLRREREAGKATQALRQRSSSVVSSQHHSSEASRRISPKASSGKGPKSASTAAAAIGSATSSRSSSQSHHKNAEGSSHASSSHGSGQTTHQSLQPKAASHPQLHTVARDGDARAPSVHTRAATQPEAAQARMPHHHHHHHDTPASPPVRSPPANDRERGSEHAFGVESLQAAYAAKIHELALKCRNWERYAAKLLAQSEALGVENQMLKDLQSGQEQQINALEIENRALREERARRKAGEAGRASSRLGSRGHRPPQSHSAGELAEQYARGGNATAAARALNLGLADISVPSPPRYAASNGHSFDGPACSSNLYIDERDEEDARSDLRIPTPVSSISLPYHAREQDGQMHTITKQHYSQHQHQHQHQHIQQHAPHHSVPSNKSSNNSLSEHKSRMEMVNNGRIPQLGNGGRMSDPTSLADGHGRYVQQQQQQSHHPSHHRRESHLYDIVGQDAFARDDAELYAEGRPSSRMSSAARRLVECQTQTDDSNGGSARISSSSTFPPSSYIQGNALTKQALAALGKPNNALLGLGAPPASASANHLGGERSIKSSTSPTSEAQRKTSGESLDMPKRRGSPVELHDDHQGGDSNHFAGLRALEGNLQSRSGSSHSDAKTVTEDYLQGAVEQRRQLRRTSLSQQQQLMYLQAQAHQAATISSQSEVNLPFARPPSRPGSRMSNNSGANFEIRSRSRNRSRAGSSSVHDIIPVALDDVFSDGLPSAASSVFTGLHNGGVRPQQPLSANSSAQNSKQNISSSSSYNDFSERGADENEENVAPRSTSMMDDMRPKSPTPPSSAAFHLHGQHAPEASDHSDGPSTKAGYSTDAETMSELQATPSDEDEKRGAHRRLYMKLREELNTAELTKFEKYVHRYDALEIPLHGGRGLLNRVKKLLLVSNPELRTGPLDMKKRKELAREFERIVRADERTST
ncbi:hypothetical protein FA10DRAFT_277931 [Acaromyces ingoldii]|uniref:Uncharacterized protein n=1 Tax=Acaromyces ingoldii TaxID=215250 RepID=A0A316YXY0_9BASI|nr:hypothetical protein FA10DRAFT_277931 [Acaromyces ingoldii]PWN94370.1 hypothetical protein FA10DRAFT_277931 [Acaromyces ingoldii]